MWLTYVGNVMVVRMPPPHVVFGKSNVSAPVHGAPPKDLAAYCWSSDGKAVSVGLPSCEDRGLQRACESPISKRKPRADADMSRSRLETTIPSEK
jgi:hypothetical protein